MVTLVKTSFFDQLNRQIRLVSLVLIMIMSESFFIYGDALKEGAPHFDDVMAIVTPLRYSGINNIIGDDSKLTIDFRRQTWTLYNVYHYNEKGELILNEGQSGLCGGLARYVYNKILPIFPKNKYDINFVKVKDSNFFNTPDATHIVLSVLNKKNHYEYVLDPSFKAYGRKSDFKRYSSYDYQDPDSFIKYNKSTNKSFDVDFATPLLVKNKYLLTFSVESIDGTFDQDHFIIALAATYRGASTSQYVFALRYENGGIQISKNEELLKQLLSPEEALRMVQRLMKWLNENAADKF
jgi:hypothetical protein